MKPDPPAEGEFNVSNPAKSKGTAYENKILRRFQTIFGSGVTRSAAGTASNDLAGLPWAVECKAGYSCVQTAWIRNANRHHGRRWLVCWNGGDGRKKDHLGEVSILPTEFLMELMEFYKEYGGSCESP